MGDPDDIFDLRPLLRDSAGRDIRAGMEIGEATREQVRVAVLMPPRALAEAQHPFAVNTIVTSRAQIDELVKAVMQRGAPRAWLRAYAKGWRVTGSAWSERDSCHVLVLSADEPDAE